MSKVLSTRWACSLAALVALALAVLLAPASAFADDYTYEIRVWDGNQGNVTALGEGADNSAGPYATITGIEYGDYVVLHNRFDVAMGDNKYYQKGYRVSGTDNQKDGGSNLVDGVTVTEDMDFVVAYGMVGDQASYTLRFVEYGTGRELAAPVTRYGNKGDRPVVAFEYIDGYRPRYRNITGTLGDEGTNDWTFEYIPLAVGENQAGTGTTTTTYTYVPGPAGTATTTGTDAGTTAGTAGTTAGTGAAAGTTASTGTTGGTTVPTTQAPPATEEILDVSNPLADTAGQSGTSANEPADQGFPWIPVIPIAVAVIAAIAGITGYAVHRSRKNKEEFDNLQI